MAPCLDRRNPCAVRLFSPTHPLSLPHTHRMYVAPPNTTIWLLPYAAAEWPERGRKVTLAGGLKKMVLGCKVMSSWGVGGGGEVGTTERGHVEPCQYVKRLAGQHSTGPGTAACAVLAALLGLPPSPLHQTAWSPPPPRPQPARLPTRSSTSSPVSDMMLEAEEDRWPPVT